MSDPFLGEIRLFGFTRTPIGWLACNGQSVRIAEYDALFAVIGTTFGGDGTQSFNVPDLQGRVPIGLGSAQGRASYRLGQVGGEEQHALTAAEVPSHGHALTSSTIPADAVEPGPAVHLGTATANRLYAPKVGASPYSTMRDCVSLTGGGQGHDNMMPSVVGNYCICASGVMPAN